MALEVGASIATDVASQLLTQTGVKVGRKILRREPEVGIEVPYMLRENVPPQDFEFNPIPLLKGLPVLVTNHQQRKVLTVSFFRFVSEARKGRRHFVKEHVPLYLAEPATLPPEGHQGFVLRWKGVVLSTLEASTFSTQGGISDFGFRLRVHDDMANKYHSSSILSQVRIRSESRYSLRPESISDAELHSVGWKRVDGMWVQVKVKLDAGETEAR